MVKGVLSSFLTMNREAPSTPLSTVGSLTTLIYQFYAAMATTPASAAARTARKALTLRSPLRLWAALKLTPVGLLDGTEAPVAVLAVLAGVLTVVSVVPNGVGVEGATVAVAEPPVDERRPEGRTPEEVEGTEVDTLSGVKLMENCGD